MTYTEILLSEELPTESGKYFVICKSSAKEDGFKNIMNYDAKRKKYIFDSEEITEPIKTILTVLPLTVWLKEIN